MTRDLLDGFLVVVILALLVALYAKVGEADLQDQIILEKHIAEADARHEFPPCDGASIRQWGATERWEPKGEAQEPACAAAAKHLPNHILSVPLGK